MADTTAKTTKSTTTKKKTTVKKAAAKRVAPKKKDVWFVQVRGSYLPASPMGMLLYVPFAMYLTLVMLVAIYNTQSVAEGVVIVVTGFVAGGALMQWIANNKS